MSLDVEYKRYFAPNIRMMCFSFKHKIHDILTSISSHYTIIKQICNHYASSSCRLQPEIVTTFYTLGEKGRKTL